MNQPTNEKSGGPAFPHHHVYWRDGHEQDYPRQGMTLRDFFASHATEADIQFHRQFSKNGDPRQDWASREEARFQFADAMLEARSK